MFALSLSLSQIAIKNRSGQMEEEEMVYTDIQSYPRVRNPPPFQLL